MDVLVPLCAMMWYGLTVYKLVCLQALHCSCTCVCGCGCGVLRCAVVCCVNHLHVGGLQRRSKLAVSLQPAVSRFAHACMLDLLIFL
jgi:hypothetical protein